MHTNPVNRRRQELPQPQDVCMLARPSQFDQCLSRAAQVVSRHLCARQNGSPCRSRQPDLLSSAGFERTVQRASQDALQGEVEEFIRGSPRVSTTPTLQSGRPTPSLSWHGCACCTLKCAVMTIQCHGTDQKQRSYQLSHVAHIISNQHRSKHSNAANPDAQRPLCCLCLAHLELPASQRGNTCFLNVLLTSWGDVSSTSSVVVLQGAGRSFQRLSSQDPEALRETPREDLKNALFRGQFGPCASRTRFKQLAARGLAMSCQALTRCSG